jgi:very-short-patch-repair endonuclease
LPSFIFYGRCKLPISEYEPFCPNCNYGNPSFYLNLGQNNQHGDIQFGPRTKFEKLLASALKNNGIAFRANPLISLSACLEYTPDFLIRERLIVEVDGGIHDADFRKTPDRIRQRALEKLGYTVYRVRNEVVVNSPQKVTEEILQQYYEAFDAQIDRSSSLLSKARKIENTITSQPEEDQVISVAIRLQDNTDKWDYDQFRKCVSEIDQNFLTNPCYTERLILLLLGLGLTKKTNGQVDFKNFLDIFMKGINIMSKLYGDQAKTYLVNSFSITAANFMKNLIFQGGPKIKRGLVDITNTESLEENISEFNNNFSRIGIKIEKDDVKTECRHKLERIYPVGREKFSWLSNWINTH